MFANRVFCLREDDDEYIWERENESDIWDWDRECERCEDSERDEERKYVIGKQKNKNLKI